MRWWPWERTERTVTIKVNGLERIQELEAEREFLFRNYKMQRDDNYRILENRALRQKIRAQKQANKDRKQHYEKRISDLVQVITDFDALAVRQRAEIQGLRAKLKVLEARPCKHIGIAVTSISTEHGEIIQVENEKDEIVWKRFIPRPARTLSETPASNDSSNSSSDDTSLAVSDRSEPSR